MPLLPFGQWLPDTSDYESQTQSKTVQNVYPRADGYGPWPDFASFSQALPAACRGAFYALNSDGTITIFAGTSNKLYQLNNSTFAWTDVSLGGSTYSALGSTSNWQFAQTGNLVFATQANAVLQVFTLGVSSAFANAAGSPPQAAYISVVGRFLVLSGLLSQPYRIQWSGLNNYNASTSWDNTTLGSNFQDFPDGGVVRGVAGGEFGTIFQDQAIRRMAYVGGSVIFQIERVTQDLGLFAPYSIVRSGASIYFYSSQGFFKIDPGGFPEPVGRERVDRTFFADLDRGNLQLLQGASDPRTTRVYWAYKSVSGVANAYDKILGYDKVLDRWFTINMVGQFLVGISQSGTTLEALDAIAPTPLSITAMANNGSGNTRLTLTAESNSSFTIIGMNTIEVYNATGTTAANGSWKFQSGTGNPSAGNFTIIDSTHVDLGVAFVGTGTGQIGGSLDAMVLSLDAYATAVQPEIAQFNSSNTLGFFRGNNLEATLESAEQGTDKQVIYVNGFRPITDAPTVYGSCSSRMNQQTSAVAGSEVLINSRTGRCDMRQETRYSRYKVRIPAGTTWTFCAGVEPDVIAAGET